MEVSICPQSLVPFVPTGQKIKLSEIIQTRFRVNRRNYRKAYQEATKEKRKEYDHQRYLLNCEAINARQKAYDDANREHIREYQRRHYREKKLAHPTSGSVSER